MATEQSPKDPKPQTHTPHPETQNPRTKTPGAESSDAQGTAKDVRGKGDVDGNTEQQRR